ncbi:hypothetical protein BBO99_00001683 [Phytophthora kernoviae]|uniref:Lysosomal dipeptide transporter MFSD1 n=2 Tax=Phytophthora kernoviae TaxID=325452 RepID=A0A3R7JAX1_9STRA|nr:hypothetical protein G195_005071 [Phytophthora kernoviae 00238/432]KAG2525734.1 hypothetical protein JM16_003989 [Phytophthora kernoviae]KAG2527330.1 hypothetical protein JM18_003818 [Phytophthora kernoviae]RLN31861.1 hypothetical protein BBI17_000467 [Phytophthora kernoviae]RLN83947.1 hypothetical protein BBO99_00001683 [Phytophthora kernoviae]
MEKSELRVRWLVLFLSCLLMIGNYYCFDNPAALKSQLQQHFSNIPNARYEFLFNLLYTLYSIPNILLPFFGGVLVDRFGARVMLFAFSTAILAGQLIFATGGNINCDDDAWKLGPLTKIYCATKTEAAQKAATPMSIPYIISAVISPFLGFVVDRIGLRALLALVAPLALTAVHIMLGLTVVNLYVPLVLQGVAYSVFAAALWPSVPYVVQAKHVGTAYGAITAIQNIGLSLFPLAVATEFNHDERYIPGVELLFVSFGVLGSLVGIALNVVDYQNGSILNGTNGKKRRVSLMMDEDALDSEALLASEH